MVWYPWFRSLLPKLQIECCKCTDGTQMQSLELGNTSPTDLKLRRRSRRYFPSSRAYLISLRRRLASRDLDPLRARLKYVGTRVLKVLLVILAIFLAFLASFAAWIALVVLYEICLGLGMEPPEPKT